MLSNFIDKVIKTAETFKNKYLIVLVANVENITTHFSNYKDTPIQSEFLSLLECNEILYAIRSLGYEAICYTDELDFIEAIINKKIVTTKRICVINIAQKGTAIGRKSLIPSFCDLNKIIYTNSDAYICSFARNKFHWYKFLQNHTKNLLVSWCYSFRDKWIFGEKPAYGTKVIAKLGVESSSIGLTQENVFVYNEKQDKFLDDLSNKYKQRLIVQKFVSGYEIEVPILSDGYSFIALPPVGISMNSNKFIGDSILDYNIRYNHKYEFFNFDLYNHTLAKIIMKETESIAAAINLRGISRIDYRITPDNHFYITDINAHPHLTKDMSVYYALNELGYKDYQLGFAILIGLAICNQSSSQS